MSNNLLLQAVILGILQGLTEFLPISSSAHLLILPWLMDWDLMGVTFDVMLHGGTLLAVLAYFRQDFRRLAVELIGQFRGGPSAAGSPKLLWPLAAGTLPAALVGAAFHSEIEETFRQPTVVVATLSFFALVLWIADRKGTQKRDLFSLRWTDGMIVGLAQTLAFVPGVSRAGITITAALFLGMTRADSARFSFLLAVPVIGLATAAKTYDFIIAPPGEAISLGPLFAGVLFSSLSGFLCIKYLIRFLQARSFLPFIVYRLILAVALLWTLVV